MNFWPKYKNGHRAERRVRPRAVHLNPQASLVDFKLLVGIEELCRLNFEGAGKLKDIIEADVLLSSLNVTHKIPVRFDHLAKLLLGNTALRAQCTEAFAEG